VGWLMLDLEINHPPSTIKNQQIPYGPGCSGRRKVEEDYEFPVDNQSLVRDRAGADNWRGTS